MGPMKTVAAIACGAMLVTSAAATAQTTQDRKTFVTFSGPVSIPGTTLPAGTYTFRLADSPTDRHIVQVFDKDETKIMATLLAVPADRVEAEGEPVVTFKETAANRPPAVRYWYYAGERAGNEFIYPKSQAMEIARASGESVMSVDTDSTSMDDWNKGTTSRVTADTASAAGTTAAPSGTASTSSTAGTSTASTTGTSRASSTTATPATPPAAPVTTTPPTAEPRPVPVDQTAGTSGRSEPSELPRTASELPMVGLIGALALAGALALRYARRATV